MRVSSEKAMAPTAVLLPGTSMDGGAWWAAAHGVARSWTRLSNFTFTFHFHALEKEMATHSSVHAWRIPGTGEPGGLPSMGLHRVGHDWTDLALALGVHFMRFSLIKKQNQTHIESEGKKSWFGRLFKKGLIFLKKDLTPNLFFMSFLFDLTGFISWCPCQDSLPKLVRKAYLKKS